MSGAWHVFLTWRLSLALLCLGQGACMGTWPVRQSTVAAAEAESSLAAALAFAERVAVFSNAENARERALLNLSGTHPGGQMRLALLYGMPLEAGDLVKGQGVLLSVLANDTLEAAPLHPLARLLLRQYQERQRQETASERLGLLLREQQRRVDALQGKLDALVGIEATLPPRPSAGKSFGRSGQ